MVGLNLQRISPSAKYTRSCMSIATLRELGRLTNETGRRDASTRIN